MTESTLLRRAGAAQATDTQVISAQSFIHTRGLASGVPLVRLTLALEIKPRRQ